MRLPQSLTTVTPFSKVLALFLFVLLPLAGFIVGMEYQKNIPFRTVSQDDPTSPCLACTWLTPTPSNEQEAKDWKTYRNEEYGFELRYPKDYELITSESETSLQLFPIAIGWKVISNEKYKNYPLLKVVQEELQRDIPYEEIKETQLNDYDAVIVSFKIIGGNQIKQSVFVKHPDKNVYLRFNSGTFSMMMPLTPSPRPKHIPSDKDFDQILSTFKFVE